MKQAYSTGDGSSSEGAVTRNHYAPTGKAAETNKINHLVL
jgi:hypothetical protein